MAVTLEQLVTVAVAGRRLSLLVGVERQMAGEEKLVSSKEGLLIVEEQQKGGDP